MINNQKGFTYLILLTVIILIGITGFFYYSRQKGLINILKQENSPTPTNIIDETVNWQNYISNKYNFSFKYPGSLNIDTANSVDDNIRLEGENGILLIIMINPIGYSPDLPNKEFTADYIVGKGIAITSTKINEPTRMRNFDDGKIIYLLPNVKVNNIQLDYYYQYDSETSQPIETNDNMFFQILSTFRFGQSETAVWKEYKIEKAGLTFKAPKDLKVASEEPNPGSHTIYISNGDYDPDSPDTYYQLYIVFNPNTKNQPVDLEGLKNDLATNSIKELTVDGYKALRGQVKGERNRYVTYIAKNNTLVSAFTSQPTKENEELSNKIIATFDFK